MECRKCGCTLKDSQTYCIRCGYDNIDEYVNEELGIDTKDIRYIERKSKNNYKNQMKFHNFLVALWFISSLLGIVALFLSLNIATILSLIISVFMTVIMYKRKFIAWFLMMAGSILSIIGTVVGTVPVVLAYSDFAIYVLPSAALSVLLDIFVLRYYYRRKGLFN